MRTAVFLLVSALLLIHTGTVAAESKRAKAVGGKQMVERWFDEAAPVIGERLPDLELLDATGKPVKLRDVASGQFTVLVLGCLT